MQLLGVAVDTLTIIKLGIFVRVTIGLAYISRASLLAPRSHGFPRFFAWEAILGLALFDVELWFHDIFSWHQLISWPLLLISAVLVIVGLRTLKKRGRPDGRRDDVHLMGVEKTTTLVRSGVYRHIRHPLYSSLLFLAWGIFFKAPSWWGGGLALLATLCLALAARIEEMENIRFFGKAYRRYMKQSKMFVPYLF